MLSARTLVENEPNYSYVTARLLAKTLYHEAFDYFDIEHSMDDPVEQHYPAAFKAFIHRGVELGMLNPKLQSFDLDKMAAALQPERDLQFTYLSLQTLYDRYFIHDNKVRYELPQVCFMRVAMGLALEEDNREEDNRKEKSSGKEKGDREEGNREEVQKKLRKKQIPVCF